VHVDVRPEPVGLVEAGSSVRLDEPVPAAPDLCRTHRAMGDAVREHPRAKRASSVDESDDSRDLAAAAVELDPAVHQLIGEQGPWTDGRDREVGNDLHHDRRPADWR